VTNPELRRYDDTAVLTPANVVTLARLVATAPWLALVARRGDSWGALAGWAVLGASDGVDGWLARRDGETRSGAFLDPLADKVFTVGGFVALAIDGKFAWLPVGLITGRELAVQVYRSLLGRRGVSMPATMLGKVKTNIQMGAVALAITPGIARVDWVRSAGLWTAVAVTLASGIQIVVRVRRRDVESARGS
jgi:CDP-diacylglycerol--glycerol-3-phosphate 3-phosphatidyltransferase